jgi:hypothetical protein
VGRSNSGPRGEPLRALFIRARTRAEVCRAAPRFRSPLFHESTVPFALFFPPSLFSKKETRAASGERGNKTNSLPPLPLQIPCDFLLPFVVPSQAPSPVTPRYQESIDPSTYQSDPSLHVLPRSTLDVRLLWFCCEGSSLRRNDASRAGFFLFPSTASH